MRHALLLAVLPLLAASCTSSVEHVQRFQQRQREDHSQVSTQELALALLDSEEFRSFRCSVDGEAVAAVEAERRVRALAAGESLRLRMTRAEGVIELRVTGDDRITVSSRSRSFHAVRSRR